jgi:hypothetical protein
MRNDIHSPKNLVPADYEYVAQEIVPGAGIFGGYDPMMGDIQRANREIIRAHMARTGGTYSGHDHAGNCGVCGSPNAIYTVLFYHAKTNTYVRTGQDCAETIDARAANGMDKLRDEVKRGREAVAGKNKAKAVLAEAGLTAAWDIYATPAFYPGGDVYREPVIITDIVGKLVKYGSVSDRQLDFLRKLVAEFADKPAREAERAAKRAAEAEAAEPCPTGRLEVTGTILSVRVDDTMYGPVTKMLVKAAAGFKLWGTMPAGCHGDKGDTVTFKATIEPSRDDPKFGFFKRPKLVNREPVAA